MTAAARSMNLADVSVVPTNISSEAPVSFTTRVRTDLWVANQSTMIQICTVMLNVVISCNLLIHNSVLHLGLGWSQSIHTKDGLGPELPTADLRDLSNVMYDSSQLLMLLKLSLYANRKYE